MPTSLPEACIYLDSKRGLTRGVTNQASVYGKCVVADYNSVHKDKCAKEFLKLKDCYLVS